MKQLFRTLTFFVLPLLVVACNTDYNFDNISLEVTVGDTNGIAIPLGETGTITVEDLLKDAGLGTNEDGYYGFEYGDSFEYVAEVGTLAPLTGLAPAIEPINETLLGGFSTAIEPFVGRKDIDLPDGFSSNFTITSAMLALLGDNTTVPLTHDRHTFEESVSIKLPEQVASLEEVTFGADGNGSILNIQLDLGGFADVSESCTINSLYFELPAGFTVERLVGDPLYDHISVTSTDDSATDNLCTISNYTFTGSHVAFGIVLKKVALGHFTPDENNVVTISEDVTFALDASVALQEGSISATSPYIEIEVTPEIYDATIKTNEVTYSLTVEEQINESVEIPEMVTRIDYLSISKLDNPEAAPRFGLEVALSDSPLEVIELHDVEITIPECIDFDTPEGWTYAGGKLSTEKLEIASNQTTSIIDLAIKGIKSLDIVDNKVSFDSAVGLNATLVIAAGTEVHLGNVAQDLSFSPTITLDDIKIQQVTGLIDPDLSELLPSQEISLSEFTSSLEGLEMDLNIESPVLSVTVENPVGVGIDATIHLAAYKGNEQVQTLSADVAILPATHEPTTTNIIIVGDASRTDSPDAVVVEGLTELIEALPDKIVVELEAATDKSSAHTLILQDSYTFKVDYAVEAAFKFDDEKDGTIDYTVMVEDVDLSSLSDINAIVESLVLKVASESTLPVDLSVDVTLLDEADVPIESVTAVTEGKIEGSTNGEPKESECDIVLTIATPSPTSSKLAPFADIARTKKIRCDLHGTTLAGGGLRPEQYVAAKLSLLLDKGITIDLGTLLDDDNTEDDNTPRE